MRFFEYARFKFIERRKIAYVVSGTALTFLLAGALFWQVNRGSWLRYGVDFTGGTLVQVHFNQPTPSARVREYVSGFSQQTPEISKFGGENDFLIRVPEFAETGTATADSLVALLSQHVSKGQFSVVRTEAVGPKIGGELQQKALFAILLSFALTLVYLAFRFEWRFGVAAIIATFHDILITLGFISVMQLDISLPTVAAVLTIIGYSLNDTIVVFDRIRENLKKTGRREAYIDILNRSINEVLPRTIMTSGTTLAVLIALGLFGGAIIRDFALILIMGIVVGTYSSIFVASPALLEIEQRAVSPEGKRARRTSKPAKV
jgi:preprotein translocase subunit SecF